MLVKIVAPSEEIVFNILVALVHMLSMWGVEVICGCIVRATMVVVTLKWKKFSYKHITLNRIKKIDGVIQFFQTSDVKTDTFRNGKMFRKIKQKTEVIYSSDCIYGCR